MLHADGAIEGGYVLNHDKVRAAIHRTSYNFQLFFGIILSHVYLHSIWSRIIMKYV